ncbi:MAG: hypothetical protein ABSB88_09540 [Bryobacteraceae bacterium]|jgi:hypothetical protein
MKMEGLRTQIEMSEKEQLHRLIDQLPDSEIPAAMRFVQFLAFHEAPIEPEMLARIDAARANPSPGIPHEEVLREFGQ